VTHRATHAPQQQQSRVVAACWGHPQRHKSVLLFGSVFKHAVSRSWGFADKECLGCCFVSSSPTTPTHEASFASPFHPVYQRPTVFIVIRYFQGLEAQTFCTALSTFAKKSLAAWSLHNFDKTSQFRSPEIMLLKHLVS
jgi:hypothetical protein